MSQVQVQLLGAACAELPTQSIDFAADKRYQCLSYLAYQGAWVRRDELAYLFWPDVATRTARHSLRQLLRRIKALTWLSDLAPLEAERERVRWQVTTDTHTFRETLETNAYDQLVTGYSGDLLVGLEGVEANEFVTWLEHERESLRSRWRQALFDYSRELEAAGHSDKALALFDKLLTHDPLDEEALRALLRVGLKSGERRRVLDSYRSFCSTLEIEFSLSPTSETQQLVEQLQALAEAPTRSPARVAVADKLEPPLPQAVTSFVGRDFELAEISHLLGKAECRLLTLIGMGGVGKSRIALKAAEELASRYRDGAVFAPLEALQTAEALPSAIATALKLPLSGKADPLEQVKGYLGDKNSLLVLDNFEHVLDGATMASDLLRDCPKLELLVTSRERLNLEEEWLLPVEGLSYPDASSQPEAAESYDAVQLFIQRAQRVKPQFALDQGNTEAVLKIADLVQGSPLGLELAAVWIRLMPPKEIAKEIAATIDFLDSSSRNAVDRQRSLRATFEYSWQLLSEREQTALSKLSVFRGGFTREAASVIAQTPIAVLAALVDKSLLRVTPEGRYDRHPLLYQYTQEKLLLRPHEKSAVQTRHLQYYHRFLAERQPKMHRVKNSAALFAVEDELENIRLAWYNILESQRIPELKATCRNLMAYCDGRGQFHFAYELFQDAIEKLSSEQTSALSLLFIEQAWCCLSLGRYIEGVTLAEKGLSLAYSLNEKILIVKGLNTLGALFRHLGRFSEARALYLDKRKVTDYKKHPINIAVDAYNLAAVEYALGNFSEAKSQLNEVLAVSQTIGAQNYIARAKNRLGLYELRAGAAENALLLLHEALDIANTTGLKRLTTDIKINLADSYTLLNETTKAQQYIDEAVKTANELGNDLEIPAAMSLGKLAQAHHDYRAALSQFERGVQLAWASQELPYVISFLARLAELELAKDPIKAGRLLSVVLRHPMSPAYEVRKARQLVAKLQAGSAAEGSGLSLDEAIFYALEE